MQSVRMSTLFGRTLREAPRAAETPGHQLLQRAGFIRQLGSGIYTLLPLAQRSMARISASELRWWRPRASGAL